MPARGHGAIVSTTTMVASFGQPGMAIYGASRAALELLTKAWAAEYGPRGVRVNAVAPGPTRTPMNEAYGDMPERFAALAPAGRVAEPEEIAPLSPTSPATKPASSTGPPSPSTAAAPPPEPRSPGRKETARTGAIPLRLCRHAGTVTTRSTAARAHSW
jgi:NAD(P)-dependent dehydrogenase (short-subunit alcohol dehydrogenase family)